MVIKILPILLLALLTGGCATTYVPISWGFGDKVQQLSRSDLFLSALFDRYDPERYTLRVAGDSFDQVMMPSEVKNHLGAYRSDTQLIYRSLYQEYGDGQLRSLMLHELAHHIWHSGMTKEQRKQWGEHLMANPSPLQTMVRRVYERGSDFENEDFAYTVEYARPVDIEELAQIKIITPQQRDAIMKEKFHRGQAATAPHGATLLYAAGADPPGSAAQPTDKGPGPAK